MITDGLLARRDNVFVEHAYETVSDARVSIDDTSPSTMAGVRLRALAAALRIKLASGRCHSVR
ncbi:hypothetical protein XI05_10060 [Bradyrhizobium sp. CCBAU 11357]|nr:hypothetical protein [Bradyrhizobium sp. CCBAU 11357]